ncbi:MAG: glycoside hydrolase family 3 protein, partial [Chryseobacterium sp.]
GKRLIQQAVDKGEISEDRIKESVLKILKTKYLLGLTKQKPMNPKNINNELNNESHRLLTEKLYANAATLLKNENSALPLKKGEQIYYVGLEEATGGTFAKTLGEYVSVIVKKPTEIASIPTGSKVIVGFHKDNSTAYKPYKISAQSKAILNRLSADRRVILDVFGSPYALRDVDIDNVAAVLVSYENNDLSMIASAKALAGQTNISGRLPVTVNQNLQAGAGMDLTTSKTAQP